MIYFSYSRGITPDCIKLASNHISAEIDAYNISQEYSIKNILMQQWCKIQIERRWRYWRLQVSQRGSAEPPRKRALPAAGAVLTYPCSAHSEAWVLLEVRLQRGAQRRTPAVQIPTNPHFILYPGQWPKPSTVHVPPPFHHECFMLFHLAVVEAALCWHS